MPWGLWKSRREIHRKEWERLDAEWHELAEERSAGRKKGIAECRASLERLDLRCAELGESHDRGLEEARTFRQEMLDRMVAHDVSMNKLERQLILLRTEAEDSSKASTEALFRLIDRFDEWEGRPPGPPDLRSV